MDTVPGRAGTRRGEEAMAVLEVNGTPYQYTDINGYAEEQGLDISGLPYSIRVLLENLLRHRESAAVREDDIRALAAWNSEYPSEADIAFHPARVVMQDLTGAPAIADLAAMRDALYERGGDIGRVNPCIPVDLVVDHSVMVDAWGTCDAFEKNVELEFLRNGERYRLFKWASSTFDSFTVIPPETGIVHQVNLEYLARCVRVEQHEGVRTAFCDTCIGTDSHTTMINGLSVLGWGVGGIEAEAAMLGQPVSMMIPAVVGFYLSGSLNEGCTATDLVLQITYLLRKMGVVGSFVEFYGPALSTLTVAERATIANMAPEYGATCGFFPIDGHTLSYLRLTGRDEEHVALVEAFAKAQGLWYSDDVSISYSDTLSLDLSQVRPSLAGPRRPQDLLSVRDAPQNFLSSLTGVFQVPEQRTGIRVPLEGTDHELTHGDIAIAAITSCTNTSNPALLITAGLIAQRAYRAGLKTKPWVKTSFAPGSQVVTRYLRDSGLDEALDALGFNLVGYGCTTCIGNSGPLSSPVSQAIQEGSLVTVNVLSGNRNFEGRISAESKASYLASPPLVVAYALAGTILIDFDHEMLGRDLNGQEVFLSDLWPSQQEVDRILEAYVTSQVFSEVYQQHFTGPRQWKELLSPQGERYDWQEGSTYIAPPPFFEEQMRTGSSWSIRDARCLAVMPDSTTTDHISPAGAIAEHSPAGRFLLSSGVRKEDFNSYGSRRANHEVMVRGTFANIRIRNLMIRDREGGVSIGPDGRVMSIYDAAMAWKQMDVPLIVLAGREYGTGSSRDWAAKGPLLQGVRAVIAVSFERIHRSNLIGMGILPLEFTGDQDPQNLLLDGSESFDILFPEVFGVNALLTVHARKDEGVGERHEVKKFTVRSRIDTALEMAYWESGGILPYVLRGMVD